MILYYLVFILICVLVGVSIGTFMVKGTKYLINKDYAKGTAYTLLTYVIIGIELFILSNNNKEIIVFSIIYVSINILLYITIRNRTKEVR